MLHHGWWGGSGGLGISILGRKTLSPKYSNNFISFGKLPGPEHQYVILLMLHSYNMTPVPLYYS